MLCTLLVGTAYAQSRTISGTVTSAEDGTTLPGVSVTIQGSAIGTQTDANGSYSISVPESATTLVFSYLGFTSKSVTIGDNTTVNVSLATDAQTLEDVVIVGYGTSTKESFTGSAKVVSGEALERKNTSDISKALSGEVAGLQVVNSSGQPGRTATIRIRGLGSVNGNRNPLYVIDGVPMDGGSTITDEGGRNTVNPVTSFSPLSSINPADIESTTILKDAAATAIYGARGANGVILITTKSGKGKPSFVEVDAQFGSNMSLLPRYDVIKSPEQYIGLSWEGVYNEGVSEGQDAVSWANAYLFHDNYGIVNKYNMWNVADASELIDPATRTVRSGVTRRYDPENWEDHAFQASNRSELNVKFGGSSEKTNYYSSLGYLNDKGYSVNSDFERLSARLNLNHEVKSWLDASMNIGYSRSETNTGGQAEDSGSVFWFVDNIPSIYPLFLKDADGNNIPDPYFGGSEYDYGDGRGFGGLTNAIADANFNRDRHYRNDLNGNAALNFNIIDGLTFENRLGFQYYHNKYVSLTNKFYGSAASQNGSIYQQRSEMTTYNLLNLLRYKKGFGDHNFEALVAHESTDWRRNVLSASAYNLVENGSEDFNNAIVSNPVGSYTLAYTLESYFSQINYDYKNTYYLSGSVRRDGSSRFLKNKWGNFGSVGAAWILSNEEFLQSTDWISFLKLKASYGLIGEQAGIGYYPGYDLYNIDNLNDNPAFSFGTKGNPDLTWETSKMFQTGVEFSLGNYLTGSLDYYVKNTTDLIFDRRVGPSIGYALIKVNGGSLRNQGLEFDLTGKILNTDDYHLNIGVNGELFKNKLTSMPIDPATGLEKPLDIQGNYGWAVGHSVYDFYMREWAGVDPEDGKGMWKAYYLDNNGNGQADAGEYISSMSQFINDNPDRKGDLKETTTKSYANATRSFVGKSAIPKLRGAINLSAGYKDFDLSIQMLYSFGGYAYDGAYARLMNNDPVGGNNWHTDIMNRWQNEGDITDVPRLSNGYDTQVASASTRFLTKANYVTLNNVRLGYNVPSNFLNSIGVAGASVWVSADNLWAHTQRKGFYAFTSEAGSSDMYRYAPLSTVSAGVKVRF